MNELEYQQAKETQIDNTIPIRSEMQKLSPSAIIDMVILDITMITGVNTDVYYFHNGLNSALKGIDEIGSIQWQGQVYTTYPFELTGLEYSSSGSLPRPRLKLGQIGNLIATFIFQYKNLLGAKVTRVRTMAKFLDAVNFPGNINADADPDQEFPREVYYIDRKVTNTPEYIEFELASSLDLQGVMLPRRQCVQNTCQWVYKGEDCGYAGTRYFDSSDRKVTLITEDICGKRLKSCELRFGVGNVLPYGGFPGVGRVGYA